MQSVHAQRPLLIALDIFENFYKEHFYMKAYLGVLQYARDNPRWKIFFNDSNLSLSHKFIEFENLKRQGVSGIIFSWQRDAVYERIHTSGLPAVNIRGVPYDKKTPTVCVDGHAAGRMAANHFLERGFRNFGYCGPGNWKWASLRREGFEQTLRKAGCSCSLFTPEWGPLNSLLAPPLKEWASTKTLHAWLKKIPKPAAIFVCQDRRALYVLETCLEYGIQVPEEVAILGADNDELLCNARDPNLSSVDLNCERVGYEAAALLDRIMQGYKPPSNFIRIEPREIVVRRSTSVLAVEDPAVAKAQMFIHDHLAEPIGVPDLIRACQLSRSSLEHKFRDHLGHSMVDEIRRRRLEKAKTLLVETDLTMDEIARDTGFHYGTYLINIFTKFVGESPHAWRMAQRAGTDACHPEPVRLIRHRSARRH